MALGNILPYTALGAGGGSLGVQWYPVGAATLVAGEPFVLSSSAATEAGTDPSLVHGFVAATPVDGFAGTAINYPFVKGLNPDRVVAANDSIPCYMSSPDQLWITKVPIGSALATAPALSNLGATCSILKSGEIYGLYNGQGNALFRIMKVLDAQGRELGLSFNVGTVGVGVYTVFKQIAGF